MILYSGTALSHFMVTLDDMLAYLEMQMKLKNGLKNQLKTCGWLELLTGL